MSANFCNDCVSFVLYLIGYSKNYRGIEAFREQRGAFKVSDSNVVVEWLVLWWNEDFV